MSELRTNLLSNAAGTGPAGLFKQSAAKAFLYATYSAGVPVIQKSLNITSLVDNGPGDLTMNLTSAMDSTSFAVPGASRGTIRVDNTCTTNNTSASATRVYMYSNIATASYVDDGCGLAAFGDLA
jgi:hypothetical protein